MDDLSRAMATSSSALSAQALRLRLIAENLAGADVPGFRRKLVSFDVAQEGAAGAARVVPGRVRLDRTPVAEVLEPGHPLADADGLRPGSNVDPIIEIADAREAHRSYEASLSMFDQARRMRGGLLDLLQRR
ncbi:MAG: flagellar basal body rod C-terminal domain-containing protein [Pseudomonadota bacterium]